MAKIKYRLDKDSLTYQKVEATFRQKFLRFLSYFITAAVFAVSTMILSYNLIDSPKEKSLKREIEQYKRQYQFLDRKLGLVSTVLDDLAKRDDDIYRLIFEAEPLPTSVRKAGIGGSERYKDLEGFESTELIKSIAKKIDLLSRQAYIQSKSFDEIFEMAKSKEKMMACVPAIMPIKIGQGQIISGFGYRIHPIYKTLRMHTGIDISARKGTPVYATGDGVVTNPDGHMSGYGIAIVINHGYGYETLYGHLSKSNVRPGQKVKRGDLIGYVGSTGLSVAPHLHYEVMKNGRKINPVNFFYNDLSPEEYKKVIEVSSQVNQALS
ncbi:MAG: M23 family metallopeptidase [Bacteroidetes bacterium]|nr:M23 family metallopeptidase [Bacteroidota bacterium]MBU1718374.1 M23 family metallopeptidase [Bacteroidota bacterium]